jgi:hypothetical protein
MLYKIQKNDINKAAQILGESFADYPIFKYILPDNDYRKKKIHHLFLFLINMGMIEGDVVAPSKRMEGVSIWIHSSKIKASFSSGFKAGIMHLFFSIDLKSLIRFIDIGTRKQKVRTKILTGPYYLLDAIGVDPHAQRCGLGRMMIETKLHEFDAENVPCYLETSNPKNLLYYQKFGFCMIHEYEIMNITIFCLLRRPR